MIVKDEDEEKFLGMWALINKVETGMTDAIQSIEASYKIITEAISKLAQLQSHPEVTKFHVILNRLGRYAGVIVEMQNAKQVKNILEKEYPNFKKIVREQWLENFAPKPH